jgi:hypothetical protein
MVNRAEWLRFGFQSHRCNNQPIRGCSTFQETSEGLDTHIRHIAGYDRVPVGLGARQSCISATQGATTRNFIRMNGIAKGSIAQGVADQRDGASCLLHNPGYVLDKQRAAIREQSFILAHPGTPAPHQHIPRTEHERIITLVPKQSCEEQPFARNKIPSIIGYNKYMRFCLELVLGTTVALAVEPVVRPPARRVVSVVHADAKTGRLVRSIVVPKKSKQLERETDAGYRGLAQETAKSLDVSPALVDAVIQVESNYNAYAVSPKGAQGLMQLMPATARRFGVENSFDPRQNIEGGVKYLKFLQETLKDDRLAIAAYNAGEKAVARYGNVPPYRETMDYVEKVGKKYGQAKQQEKAAAVTAKAAEKPKPMEDEHRHVVGYVDEEGRLHIATR